MSVIHYKFKAAKNYDSVTFEGLSFPLFNLKREILIAQKLKGTDCDIIISNAQTNEDYLDDSMLIPKNTSVYVRRVPAKPGGTNAMYYISDDPQNALQAKTGEIHADLSSYGTKPTTNYDEEENNQNFGDITLSLDGVIPGENEEEKLQALFDQTSTQWRQTSHNPGQNNYNRGNQGYNNQRNQNQYNKPISANYVCHKCGIKGHYVQNCTAQSEKRNMQPRVKKTTGIPRSFLKNVEQTQDGKGTMVASDGSFVVAQANSTAWEKIRLNQWGSGFSFEELRETAPVVEDLECKICYKLLIDAVSVPCCGTLFCLECITEALINPDPEKHFRCPTCNKSGIVPDNLIAENTVRANIDNHLRQWAKQRRSGGASEQQESEHIEDKEYNESQSHVEISSKQIASGTDSRDNYNEYPNEDNDYNTKNDYNDMNNYNDRDDYNNRNYDRDIGKEEESRLDFNTNDNRQQNENDSNTIELPPLHWTPENGITGHINIPPMEQLVGTEFYEENFGKKGKNYDHNYSHSDRRSGRSRERDSRGQRSRNSRRSRSRSNRNRYDRRASPSPRRHYDDRDRDSRRSRVRSHERRSRRSRSRSSRRSPDHGRSRRDRSSSKDHRSRHNRDDDRYKSRERSRSRNRDYSRRDNSRNRDDNRSSRNLSRNRYETSHKNSGDRDSRPSISSRLGPPNM